MRAKRGLWVVGSAVLHVVLVLLLLQAMLTPRSFISLFRGPPEQSRIENLTYVVPVPQTPPPRVAVPAAAPRVQAMPVAPTQVPTTLPVTPRSTTVDVPVDSVAPRAVAGPPSSGTGGGVGLPVLNPAHPDPKLMRPGTPLPEPPKLTGLAGIEYGLDSILRSKRDSMLRLSDPSDWTVGEGKKKFGLDKSWLYLGPVKIPSLVLALIPLKGVQANPNMYERSRTLGAMASEVRERGARSQGQREEINAVNARLQRERDAKIRAAAAAASKIPPA